MLVQFNQSEFTRLIRDQLSDPLWECWDFVDTLCAGCPALQEDGCASDLDILSARCERRGLVDAIESILSHAARDIACELDNYGCLDALR